MRSLTRSSPRCCLTGCAASRSPRRSPTSSTSWGGATPNASTRRPFGMPQLDTGLELGPSRWLEVDQGRIDRFASATEDSQWIHTNRERAAAGPFGVPIAHGFLTLSLLPELWFELF